MAYNRENYVYPSSSPLNSHMGADLEGRSWGSLLHLSPLYVSQPAPYISLLGAKVKIMVQNRISGLSF